MGIQVMDKTIKRMKSSLKVPVAEEYTLLPIGREQRRQQGTSSKYN
jgi:hypothetical protein